MTAYPVSFVAKQLAQARIFPTSQINDVGINTMDSALIVSMSVDGSVFYESRLYAYDGKVTIYDVGDIIESYFRKSGLCRAVVTFKAKCVSSADYDTMSVDFLYCSRIFPNDFTFEGRFFNSQRVRRVPHDAAFRVYGDFPAGSAIMLNVAGLDSDGNPDSSFTSFSSQSGYFDVNVKAWSEMVCQSTSLAAVSMMSLRCGNAEMTLFIQDSPDLIHFVFRNCFNVPEPVWLGGVSVLKPSVDSETAVCNGKLMQYDRSVTHSYQHTSGPLSRLEAAALIQLLESEQVWVVVDGVSYDVIISDHSTEVSSDDDTMNVLKFTWQFADSRPHTYGDSLDQMLYGSKIFTEQYQNQYM